MTDIGNRDNTHTLQPFSRVPDLANHLLSQTEIESSHQQQSINNNETVVMAKVTATNQFNEYPVCTSEPTTRRFPPSKLPINPISIVSCETGPSLICSPNLETPFFTPYSPPDTPFGAELPNISGPANLAVLVGQCCSNLPIATTITLNSSNIPTNNATTKISSQGSNNSGSSSSTEECSAPMQFSSSQSSMISSATTTCSSTTSTTFEILAVSKKEDYDEDEDFENEREDSISEFMEIK